MPSAAAPATKAAAKSPGDKPSQGSAARLLTRCAKAPDYRLRLEARRVGNKNCRRHPTTQQNRTWSILIYILMKTEITAPVDLKNWKRKTFPEWVVGLLGTSSLTDIRLGKIQLNTQGQITYKHRTSRAETTFLQGNQQNMHPRPKEGGVMMR